MKILATIQADLEVTALGMCSRLAEDLHGVPVLRRTVERVMRAAGPSGFEIIVLCPSAQRERCSALLAGTPAGVQPFDADPPPWASLVRTARKWSLDAWRGGLGGTTVYDEFTDPRLIVGLLDTLHQAAGSKRDSIDAVLSVPAAGVVIDPVLIDRMIAHRAAHREEARMTFASTPPGLSGILLDVDLVRELARNGIPLGWMLSYKPDNPQKDLIFQTPHMEVEADVRHAYGRLIADTDRAWQRLSALMAAHADPDAGQCGRWLREHLTFSAETLPQEVEIELTTDDPYPASLIRPRGERVPSRGPISLDIVKQIAASLSAMDDTLVVLGGMGDPLRHPRFAEVLAALEAHGSQGGSRRVYGLAVRTAGVDLTDEHMHALIEHGVDVVSVLLDAWTPETYARLHAPDDFSRADLAGVIERMDRLAKVREERRRVNPLVVPEFNKARENLAELDDFHDGWLRKLGAVTIGGYSHAAGQLDDRSVMRMAPPRRGACRRIRSRCLVLADGRVAACDQDFRGLHTLGVIGADSLESIWRGEDFNAMREAHEKGRFEVMPLCPACDDWHRP